jgi:hypothetical protein
LIEDYRTARVQEYQTQIAIGERFSVLDGSEDQALRSELRGWLEAKSATYEYYGDNFKIECPAGSGHQMNLFEVAREIVNRLAKIFSRDDHGRRPVYGATEKFQSDPHWRDHILFYEYFHGDNGAGVGASHQTGWTGVVGSLIDLFGRLDPVRFLTEGQASAFARGDLPRNT